MTVDDALDEAFQVPGGESRAKSAHLIKDAAQTPNVTFVIVSIID